jgi:hypothetical protein
MRPLQSSYSEGQKDRLQEVPKGDKWSRRHFFSLGNACLHLKGIFHHQAMQKWAIKPHSLTWPMGSPVSRSACILQYAVFLFSSLQIKSFWPLLLESTCASILRVGSRTPSTWNSCACHPCIIIFGNAQRDQPSLRVSIGCSNWEILPRNVTKSVWHSGGVCFPGETPHHGLAMVKLSGQLFSLSLCLVKEAFLLGKLKKRSKPTTAVWQAIW